MSKVAPKAATHVKVSVEEMRRRSDKGQGTVEYVGVLVLVSLIIAAIVGSGVDESIAEGLSNTVGEILGGGE
ncbi:hypothetical protein OG211_24955 [Streptomyces niveus]|uniref:DUF4244 domain-containing protein n=1 Tax=Streptomyces niveus TaxID=193462 RepID=A0ABZ2A5E8_STRNV|nr:hypothetical protein [Streptomyces niveus]WTA61492.1 hypothetical protein OG211_24955 [Streptomyces niveus]